MSAHTRLRVRDAQSYALKCGVKFSRDGLAVVRESEELACSLDGYLYPWTYFAVLLRRVKPLRAAIARHGADPDLAADAFADYTREIAAGEARTTSYAEEDMYSDPHGGNRMLGTRSSVIDTAIEIAQRTESAITELAFVEALLDHHDRTYPFGTNGEFTDDRFHTPHNTVAHVLGRFDLSLFRIKLSQLRDDLGFPHPETSNERPVDIAPAAVRPALHAFLVDHQDYHRNCFLIMPFTATKVHDGIARTLKAAMKSRGFDLVRADDRVYSEDLLTNIQAHIYGCRLAIAVFERILTNDFNPNVSLEVGYMLGLRKPVCLLKERTLPRLPSDLVGRLYDEFDGQDVRRSVPATLEGWLRKRGFVDKAGKVKAFRKR